MQGLLLREEDWGRTRPESDENRLVSYNIVEIKAPRRDEERVTKAKEFDRARRLAYKGDFSLVEKLYHPDCKHFDHRVGLEVNLDMQSALMTAYENTTFGPFRVIYENEEFLCIQRYGRNRLTRETLYMTLISGVNYRDKRIVRHETAIEDLDYDPSEGRDWDWKDYE